jgi:hypothetical protein
VTDMKVVKGPGEEAEDTKGMQCILQIVERSFRRGAVHQDHWLCAQPPCRWFPLSVQR